MADLIRINQLEGAMSRSISQRLRSQCGSDLDRYQSALEAELKSSNEAIAKLSAMIRLAQDKRR